MLRVGLSTLLFGKPFLYVAPTQQDLVSHLQIHMHAAHQAGASPEEIMAVLDLIGGWIGECRQDQRRKGWVSLTV